MLHAHSRFRALSVMLVAGICAVGVTGCGKRLTSCKQDNREYASARELPPLKAPPGLESPNTRNALKVPPLNTPERIRGRDEPCLDVPPPFATEKGPDAPVQPPPAAPRQPREVPTQ
jgi:uncharacterized lipoprotein